jgi:hypothetical protein
MASVTQATPVSERIDHALERLRAEWSAIPEVAAEWDTWDEPERLDFVVEWPIQEDTLWRLQDWAAQGLLSDEQRRHYNDLLEQIARHRSTLEKLLEA